jgi:hypothetical protein
MEADYNEEKVVLNRSIIVLEYARTRLLIRTPRTPTTLRTPN